MSKTPPIRVLIDPAMDGPANMARDEALLQEVGDGNSTGTLRFYQWDPPTISLGYFQHFAEYESLGGPAGELAVVRRQTGGGAILHDRELTYSLTLPLDHPMLRGGPNRLYEMAHDVLIHVANALGVAAWRGCDSDGSSAARGPFFCFARRHCFDVLVGKDKLAGSAQRRTQKAVLQHGSIVLERRFEQQPAATLMLNGSIDADELATELALSWATHTGYAFKTGEWAAHELHMAETLKAKYAGMEWTAKS